MDQENEANGEKVKGISQRYRKRGRLKKKKSTRELKSEGFLV